jgi:hypothetical protein
MDIVGKKTGAVVISDSIGAVKWFHLSAECENLRNEIEITKKKITICWLPREKNLAGIRLEKRLEVCNASLNAIINRRPSKLKRRRKHG